MIGAPAAFGWVGKEWHGPEPPGPDWHQTGTGPQGGKIWRYAGDLFGKTIGKDKQPSRQKQQTSQGQQSPQQAPAPRAQSLAQPAQKAGTQAPPLSAPGGPKQVGEGNTKPPWQMTPEEFESAGIQYFQTEQGSHYLYRNGQTIRLKVPHAHHEAKDVGLKRGSEVTYFVDPKSAQEIGMWQTASSQGKRIFVSGQEAFLTSINPRTGQRGMDGRIKLSGAPAQGLAPLELWDRSGEERPGMQGWRANHPGNQITSLVPATRQHHAMFVQAAQAAKGAKLSLEDKTVALWYTDLLRAALSQTDDVAEAVAVADHAFTHAAALGLDEQGRWHGPQPPGEGWVEVGQGERGGKIWRQQQGGEGGGATPERPAAKKVRPGPHAQAIQQAAASGDMAEALRLWKEVGPGQKVAVSNKLPPDVRKQVLGAAVAARGGAAPAPAPQAPPKTSDAQVTQAAAANPVVAAAVAGRSMPSDPQEFAREAQSIADATMTGGFGENKVFISHVYRNAKKKHPGLTWEEFRDGLLRANSQRLVSLSRADLVEAMDPNDVSQSVIALPGASEWSNRAEFHFVLSDNPWRESRVAPVSGGFETEFAKKRTGLSEEEFLHRTAANRETGASLSLEHGAAFGLDERGFWHGPQPPGEGWVQVGEGERHGKIWRQQQGGQAPTPTTGAAKQPAALAKEIAGLASGGDAAGALKAFMALPATTRGAVKNFLPPEVRQSLQEARGKKAPPPPTAEAPAVTHEFRAADPLAPPAYHEPGPYKVFTYELERLLTKGVPEEEAIRQATAGMEKHLAAQKAVAPAAPPKPPTPTTPQQVASAVAANPVAAKAVESYWKENLYRPPAGRYLGQGEDTPQNHASRATLDLADHAREVWSALTATRDPAARSAGVAQALADYEAQTRQTLAHLAALSGDPQAGERAGRMAAQLADHARRAAAASEKALAGATSREDRSQALREVRKAFRKLVEGGGFGPEGDVVGTLPSQAARGVIGGGAAFALEEAYGSEPPGPGWIYSGEARWVRGVRRSGPKVAVVGGGPGGLFAAYVINQRYPQAQVTLFESTDRLGGKILTERFGDVPYEGGVAELYEYRGGGKDPLRRLIEEDLGLPAVDMSGGGVVLKGKLVKDHDDLANHFSEATRDQIKEFHEKCAQLMPLEKYARRWQPENDHPWARKDFRTCIEKEVRDEAARDYVEAAVASDLATESHNCNGLNGVKNVLLDNDDYMQLYHVRGGVGRVAESLASRVSASVRLDTTVTAVRKTDAGLAVTFRHEGAEETETFEAVIVALPNHWWGQIDWGDPAFRARLREVTEHYDSPAHYLRVTLLFSENWWAKFRMPGDFFMWDGFGGCCVYDESHRWGHTGPHALSFLLAGQDALLQRSSNQTDAQVIDNLLASLPDFMREDARRTFLEGKVHSWVGSINAMPGGFPARDLKAEHCPDPKGRPGLFLVCDAFFDSTLNGCLISASCAVDSLLEFLKVEGEPGTEAVRSLRPDGLGLSLVGAT